MGFIDKVKNFFKEDESPKRKLSQEEAEWLADYAHEEISPDIDGYSHWTIPEEVMNIYRRKYGVSRGWYETQEEADKDVASDEEQEEIKKEEEYLDKNLESSKWICSHCNLPINPETDKYRTISGHKIHRKCFKELKKNAKGMIGQ